VRDFSSPLKAILLRRGVLTRRELRIAEKLSEREGIPLVEAIVQLGFATAEDIDNAMVAEIGTRLIDLSNVTVPREVFERVPESVARDCVVMPVSDSECSLQVAMSDPADFDRVQQLQFIANRNIEPLFAAENQILAAIDRHYGPPRWS
jgi:type IV pilus assembly protein PilB